MSQAIHPPRELDRLRRKLCALQDHLAAVITRARQGQGRRFAEVAAHTAADTIYHVDRISEAAIEAWFTKHWPVGQPVEVVMEGVETGALTFPQGTRPADCRWVAIIDPIDGTRNLMYDKRSAWALAGLAPRPARRAARLDDIVVAAMTELPVTKQTVADQLSAVRGQGLRVERIDRVTGRRRRIKVGPSAATDVRHGFASCVKFFPAGKALTAALEEHLWAEVLGADAAGAGELVFDDQYLTTGGQLYELIVGHDRFIADLRPLVFAKLGHSQALTCHPYDLCTALLLEEVGGVVEAPRGGRVRVPLDTITPVAWVGYANPKLARRLRPMLHRLLAELG
jgi:fructose-1,6-bisphosphatase/inositol monophosphatase family enzyme